MSAKALWYEFSDFEREIYDRQKLFVQYKLFSAADSLDNYSNHSCVHVSEVMGQCEAMFDCLRPWLRGKLPGEDENALLHTLMIAAKYHDIRMSPSPEELALLGCADELHAALLSGGRCRIDSHWRAIREAAEKCGWTGRTFETIAVLCEQKALSESGKRKLRELLVALHDEIKSKIRKSHAAQGALFVLDHAEKIRARYGSAVDVPLVAALVNLHSTSSSGCREIGFEMDDLAAMTRGCIEKVFDQRGVALPEDAKWLRKAVVLASILRLSDSRRSGCNMSSIDGLKLRCAMEDGVPSLYICENGMDRRITNLVSSDILCAECCSDFGSMALSEQDGGWRMTHHILVRDWDCERLWKLFCERRMSGYAEEISSAALRLSGEMDHCLMVHLPGGQGRLEELWNTFALSWKQTQDERLQTYAGCVEFVEDEQNF